TLALPVAVNTYGPTWNAFLEGVPIIGSSSSLVRWFVAYIPIVVLATALALDRIVIHPRGRIALAASAAVAVVMVQAGRPLDYLTHRGYPIDRVEQEASRLHTRGTVPAVTHVDIPRDSAGRPVNAVDRDDLLIAGVSQILSYEPMFGYLNEWMPILRLRP